MKKVFVLFASICLSIGSFAQTPVATVEASDLMPSDGNNAFSLEVLLGQSFGGGSSLVTSPGVKLRYFVQDNMAIRFGLSYFSYLSQDVATENADGSGEQGTYNSWNSNFRTKVGFEYHFGETNRLSPYVGIDGIIGFGNMRMEGTNYNSGSYALGYNTNSENKTFTYGTNILAGIDFYIAKNLYLGAEFGYGLEWMIDKEGTNSINDNGTETTWTTPKEVSRQFGFGALGGLRLGWRF